MKRAFLFLVMFAVVHAPTAHAEAPSRATHHNATARQQVRITPTELAPGETSIDIGPTGWTLQGYDLRGLLARVYDIDPARVDLDSAEPSETQQHALAESPRYDISLSLTGGESDEAIQSILRKALEERFQVKTSLETRSKDVYVLSAPNGPGKGLRTVANLRVSANFSSSATPSTITVEGRICPGLSSAGITAQSATLQRLAAALEDNLDRVVLDETNLTPAYDFQVPEYRSREELFSLLHDHLGLTVRPERRELKVLAVRTSGQAPPLMVAGI